MLIILKISSAGQTKNLCGPKLARRPYFAYNSTYMVWQPMQMRDIKLVFQDWVELLLESTVRAIQILFGTLLASPRVPHPVWHFTFLMTVFKAYMLGNVKWTSNNVPYKALSYCQTRLLLPKTIISSVSRSKKSLCDILLTPPPPSPWNVTY